MTRWLCTIDIPLAKPLPSVANLREHWAVKAKRTAAQRELAHLHLLASGAAFLREWRIISGNPAARLAVTFTRINPRELDDDNLRSAFKAVRDTVAKACGIDDRSKRYEWTYQQERGAPGYRIRLEILTTEVHTQEQP